MTISFKRSTASLGIGPGRSLENLKGRDWNWFILRGYLDQEITQLEVNFNPTICKESNYNQNT